MEKPAVLRRRNYFINQRFQAGFILRFCALVAAGGLLTIGILYLLSLQSNTVFFVNSRVVVRSTAEFILPLLIQTVLIVMVIIGLATVILTLLVSHKIAGPIYRFKKVLQALEEGDFSSEFRIRRSDQFQDVAEAFNKMIVRIKGELKTLKDNFQFLKEKLDDIPAHEVAEHKRVYLSELKRISAELNKIIHFFKT